MSGVFESTEYVPPAPTVGVPEPTHVTHYLFVRVPPHWGGIEPGAPYRQLCVILEGGVEIKTGDGCAREFAASGSFVVEGPGARDTSPGTPGTARPWRYRSTWTERCAPGEE